jgi:DHA2 family multidrug resistance protein-like MFS transporter
MSRTGGPEKAGSAAAMNETAGEFGFALGIATLGSLGTAVYRSRVVVPADIPAAAAQVARDTLAGATAAAAGLPDELAGALLTSARAAYTDGLHVVAAVSAVLLAGVAVLVVTLLRDVRPTGEAQPAEEAEAAVPIAR